MNNALSMKRLGLLIRRQAVENYKFYLLGIVVMAGLLLVIYGALYRQGLRGDSEFQDILFLFSLCLSGSVFTNLLVRDVHTKTTAIWYLMLPSSALERIGVVFFYNVLVFIPVHLLVFYAIDISFVALFNTLSKTPPAYVLDLGENQKYALFYTAFLFLQAATLVGSLYFHQYSYVKTAATLFAFASILFYLHTLAIHAFVPTEVYNAFPFYSFRTYIGDRSYDHWITIEVPSEWQTMIRFAGRYLLIPFLWIVAWVRLKETHV